MHQLSFSQSDLGKLCVSFQLQMRLTFQQQTQTHKVPLKFQMNKMNMLHRGTQMMRSSSVLRKQEQESE